MCGSGDNTQLLEKTTIRFGLRPLPPGRKLAALVLALCLLAAESAWAAEPSEVSPAKPAEYMIYQYPGVALLIRIDAIETEFESKVYGPERALVRASQVPSRRIGPVYQFIEAVDTARQLIIEVTPAYPTERSRISMELVQMPENERTSPLHAEAFRLLSRAMDSTLANDSTTWAMKVYTLKRAAYAFEQLGWEELRLWSEYFAAHLVFYKLHDELSAIELAREVQAAARKAGFGVIEMAALQLEGTALLSAGSMASEGASAQEIFSETHEVLKRASALADELGFQSERGLALFNDAVAWEKQDNLERALEQYRHALGIAVSAGDAELANRIRNNAAFAYEAQGSITGAIEMLDQIGDELSEQEAALELAESLYEKGRILNSSHRYPEAANALSKSLSLQESAGSGKHLGQTGIALGQAYQGMGLMEQAAQRLRESIDQTPASGQEPELERALLMLAGVHRFRGNIDAMSTTREEQAAFVNSEVQRARYIYEQALDVLAMSPGEIATVRSLLKQSRQLARASGDPLMAHHVLLQLCKHGARVATVAQDCSQGNIRQSYDYLVSAGSPRYALEARFAHSEILRREGRLSQAIADMNQLVDEIRYYRHVLPGVLGFWYWENRDRIFGEYMSMLLQQSSGDGGAMRDNGQLLFALNKLREIVSADSGEYPASRGASRDDGSDQIRSLLAAREEAVDEAATLRLAFMINEALRNNREAFNAQDPGLSVKDLDTLLGHLPERAALLTYYFSDNEIHAIIARRSGIRILKLPRSGEISSGLNQLRKSLGSQLLIENHDLETLGRLMVGPFFHQLPELVYLMSSGSLNGFPFDLLRLDGHYLAESHSVVNLMSLSALKKSNVRIDTGDINLFFLAGNPGVKQDVFDYEQELSAEIRAVTDIFVGPALHIVQGSALKRDEFQDERFENADIIHLAIPGTASLEFPAQSKLILSGSPEKPGGEYLMPQDFQGRRFSASLAVLSSLRLQGSNRSRFSSYLGFVTDLLSSGVDAVVASLWALEDPDLALFMAAFYQNLADHPDVATALLKTRRDMLLTPTTEAPGSWAGFQVYFD
jgi:CHAT domain-containing protein/tetratricopeptide (TPR) repeat protein